MTGYKAEVTLNEKDSLTDILNAEKIMVKLYALATTEGCSQGFRNTVKKHLSDTITDQMEIFLLLCELGYYHTESVAEEEKEKLKKSFSKEIKNLA